MSTTSPSSMSNEPAIDSGGGFVRLRLDIAYDGTDFAGWAVQAGQRTVAGVLDDALSTVFRTPVQLRAAGRTDTGVHATGQVAHVDVPADALSHAYPRATRPEDSEFLAARSTARAVPARRCPRARHRPRRSRVSTRGSRRCVGTTSIGCRPLRTASNRKRRVSSRRGRARWMSTPWRPHRETCWGCTTSPRSAATVKVPPPSAICSGWTGHATATASPPTSPPTRSAGRWCGHWSARCWRSASTAANRLGAPRCWGRRDAPATSPRRRRRA